MFLDELSPLFQELMQHPVAFLGGLSSGILRLNLADEPVRSWLDKQVGAYPSTTAAGVNNGKTSGPQSISID